jgi:hypothetical protein
MNRVAWLLGAAVPLLLAPAASAQALVVRVKSVDALLADAKYLAPLLGRAQQGRDLAGFVKAVLGSKERSGLDTGRPLGFYLDWPAGWIERHFQPVPAVVVVPVTGEKPFRDLLRRLQVKVVGKAGAGIDELRLANGWQPFLRFAHRHAYLSDVPATLRGKLPDPKTLWPDVGANRLIDARLYLERIPATEIRRISSTVEQGVRASYAFWGRNEQSPSNLAWVIQFSTMPIRDGKDLRLALDLDRKRHHLAVDLTFVPKANSQLAAALKALGAIRRVLGDLSHGASLSLSGCLPSPNLSSRNASEVLEELESAVDLGGRRAMLGRLFKALQPSNTLDIYEIAFAFHPQPREAVWVVGMKVKEGRKLENLLRDWSKDLPRADRKLYRLGWNHARYAGQRIHRLQLPLEFGTSERLVTIHVVIRDDLVLASFAYSVEGAASAPAASPAGLAVLQKVLDGLGKSAAPLARVDINPAWLALVALHFDPGDRKTAVTAAWRQFAATGTIEADTMKALGLGNPALRFLDQVQKGNVGRSKITAVLEAGRTLWLHLDVPTEILKLAPLLGGASGN